MNTYSLILFAFGVEFLLIDGVGLQVLDCLFEAHHVRMGAFVCFLGFSELHLELFVLFSLYPQVVHDGLNLLLAVAVLIHKLECVTLPVLDPLQQFDLLLEVLVLPLRIDQLVLQIGYRTMRLGDATGALDWRDALARRVDGARG